MQLLLSLCLACALLPTVELLQCFQCANSDCTDANSVECPSTSTVCRTITSVNTAGAVTVNKSCSTLQTCVTTLQVATEWSVNRGFSRQAHNQLCCITKNCNLQTMAVPSTSLNGKNCSSCANEAQSLAGNCNTELFCKGAEDACFNGTATSNGTTRTVAGCMTRNLCTLLQIQFGADSQITCRAPWSVSLSAGLLTFALIAWKSLV